MQVCVINAFWFVTTVCIYWYYYIDTVLTSEVWVCHNQRPQNCFSLYPQKSGDAATLITWRRFGRGCPRLSPSLFGPDFRRRCIVRVRLPPPCSGSFSRLGFHGRVGPHGRKEAWDNWLYRANIRERGKNVERLENWDLWKKGQDAK